MGRRGQTRYGHAFSKGKVGFHSQGSWRRQNAAMTDYPIKLDPTRWKVLKISPTVATAASPTYASFRPCVPRGFP